MKDKGIIYPVIPTGLIEQERWYNHYKDEDAVFALWTKGLSFEEVKNNPLLNVLFAKCIQAELYKNS